MSFEMSPTCWLPVVSIFLQCALADVDLTLAPGHLKPFGFGRPGSTIEEIDGFPETKRFFEDYVFPLKPVLMKGAAKLSPAYEKWQDEYFISRTVPEKVLVESKKKEDRLAPADTMVFKEFVMIYNRTDQYMVNPVPDPLGEDVVVPGPLQCQQIIENNMILENMMWFSSGGTKSVLHTDSVENINCLFRGEKTFVMVDPAKYIDQVDIDHPEGSYSSVDVDSVDYTKFPGLAEVEFVHVSMSPGDCLYIPYKWIHQVRSSGRNIAVNLWWDPHKNKDIDLSKCTEPFNKDLTVDKISYRGLNSLMDDLPAIREEFLSFSRKKPVTLETLKGYFITNVNDAFLNLAGGGVISLLNGMLNVLDKDKDGLVTHQEVLDSTDEDWTEMQNFLVQLEYLLKKMEESYSKTDYKEDLYFDEEIDRDEL